MKSSRLNNAVGPQVRAKTKKANYKLSLLILLTVLIVSLQFSTQFLAYKFHHQAILGFSFKGLYMPWQSILWWFKWHTFYPGLLNRQAQFLW